MDHAQYPVRLPSIQKEYLGADSLLMRYFLHFLVILPILGFKEKTLPIPLSITEPILGGSPNLAAAKNKESLDIK